mgnify:CR=1 FL=1
MSGTEDVVTEEDVREDGVIKANVMGQLVSVAKRESPEIFEYFEETCKRIGVEPKILLADMLVNAINDEGYADRINDTEISLRQAKMNDIRLDDAEFIKELQERFMDDRPGNDPIDDLIERSIRGATETPLGPLNERGKQNGEKEALREEVRHLRREMEAMKGADAEVDSTSGGGTVDVSGGPSRRDSESHEEEVDNLFSDGESGGGESEPDTEDKEVTTETMTEEELSEDEVEEEAERMRRDRERWETMREESGEPEDGGDDEVEEDAES